MREPASPIIAGVYWQPDAHAKAVTAHCGGRSVRRLDERLPGNRRYTFDGCLIKIETDAGLAGFGETGTNVAMARSHIAHMEKRAAVFDAPSSIAIAHAIEPLNLLFLEDALNVPFSEAWPAVKRASRVPIMTGEKLELVRGFKPFLDTQAVDIIHPDVSFAGGLTGVKKIADYAALTRTPVALHNVGSMIRTYASAHLSMAIENFYRSESRFGRPAGIYEGMVHGGRPAVRNGFLHMPNAPGLGLKVNDDHIRKHLSPGEPHWG